jgi:predicted transposase/invertase (TIGR01784 family)
MMKKFIDPFSDWGFKRIFGRESSKDLLKSFLNELFLGEFEVSDLTYLNNEQSGDWEYLRGIVYDIHCYASDGREFIVEMQKSRQEHFIARSVYYTCRAIVNKVPRGPWNYDFMPVYTVCFLDYVEPLLSCDEFRVDMGLADLRDGRVLSERFRVVYLQLPLFKKSALHCETKFDKWIYSLKNMMTLKDMPFITEDPIYQRLAEISDLSQLTMSERESYERQMRYFNDLYSTCRASHKEGVELGIKLGKDEGIAMGKAEGIKLGKEEGIEIGKAEGIKLGKAEGITMGKEEGAKKKVQSIAQRMLDMGLPDEVICEATGLSQEDLHRLRRI